ncbi:NRDE protein-domain-containing protein [Neohortaea acidophila]|uniref:NRDE protein-domain-containing protein n=1 Tax=Neohortaea acidophila TaxID=245834 RepID=A0A6A6Q7K1_9PEZI|nr:NRDE protein-domain-containing protein [Neohortaea acidophila]KAF2487926.1 NRDE protein-domain-containing protein [Neohortaea acidophila]
MCIVIVSTAHPRYPFILLSNRDEFIHRPTAAADWWDGSNTHVLGGRDLEKRERGTWLGITKQGRIAALTNFREPGAEKALDKSRGGIINAYLTSAPQQREDSKHFAKRLIDDVGVQDVGGFSLLFGELRAPSPNSGDFPGLSILSNRSADASDLVHIATHPGEAHGLSNSHFGDMSWPKVVHGEQFLRQAIGADVKRGASSDEAEFVERLFAILSIDTLPERGNGEEWESYALSMRNSIFIPVSGGPSVDGRSGEEVAAADGGDSTKSGPRAGEADVRIGEGSYGTQKQTVILVSAEGRVLLVERTMYSEDGRLLRDGEGERRFEFDIEGWKG